MLYILKNVFRKKYFLYFVLLLVILFAQVVSEILLPLSLTQLTQQAQFSVMPNFESEALKNTGILAGFMLALTALFVLCGIAAGYVSAILATQITGDIRLKLYNKIQTLSFAEIDHYKTSSLITRITTDVDTIQDSLFIGMRIGIRSIMLSLGGLVGTIILATLGNIEIIPLSKPIGLPEIGEGGMQYWWTVPLFLTAMSILMFVCLLFILVRASKQYRKSKYAIDQSNDIMRENILGVRLVKSFNLHNDQIKRFKIANENLRLTTEKSFLISMWMFPVINITMSWSVILTIFIGGAVQVIDVAKIGSIMSITTLILFGMTMLINVILQIGIALGSTPRIEEILKHEVSIKYNENGPSIEKPVVKFEKVNFKYNETGEYVLKNINLTINENETVGIIGATGSGKTTFISLITRMYDVSEGKISISGHDIKDINKSSLRHDIGISTQRVTLFSGTIASNLKYGKENATQEDMIKAAQGAQAYEFILSKEGQFNCKVEQRGRNFSGGQQQRLSIARALIAEPKILILDSSTSALDMITERKVNEYIKETNINRTTFIISQRVSGVKHADRILVFEKGKIVGDDSHINLLKNNPTYREIAISQLGEEGVENEING